MKDTESTAEWLGRFIAAAIPMVSLITRNVGEEALRRERQHRWDQAEIRAHQFYLRLGYAKAADKSAFLRRWAHFPSRTA